MGAAKVSGAAIPLSDLPDAVNPLHDPEFVELINVLATAAGFVEGEKASTKLGVGDNGVLTVEIEGPVYKVICGFIPRALTNPDREAS